MQIDLILGVLAFSGIVLTLVIVIIGARSKLVSTGDVSIEINGDSSNPLGCSSWFKITSNTC
jgi:Na+-transporting NADH:ubiquinone oxidoreductase subunit F